MSFIEKMRKKGTIYDIHDSRIGPISAEDEGKSLVIDEYGKAVPGEASSDGPKRFIIEDIEQIDSDLIENEIRPGDTLIVTYGGGSIEELWTANTWVSDEEEYQFFYNIDDSDETNPPDMWVVRYVLEDGEWIFDMDYGENGYKEVPLGSSGSSGSGLYVHYVYLNNSDGHYLSDECWLLTIIDDDPRDITTPEALMEAIAYGAQSETYGWQGYPNNTYHHQPLRIPKCVRAYLHWQYYEHGWDFLLQGRGRDGGLFFGHTGSYSGRVCYAEVMYDANDGKTITVRDDTNGRDDSRTFILNGSAEANDCADLIIERYGALTIPLDDFKRYPFDW